VLEECLIPPLNEADPQKTIPDESDSYHSFEEDDLTPTCSNVTETTNKNVNVSELVDSLPETILPFQLSQIVASTKTSEIISKETLGEFIKNDSLEISLIKTVFSTIKLTGKKLDFMLRSPFDTMVNLSKVEEWYPRPDLNRQELTLHGF